MERIIEDYNAKSFILKIEDRLEAVNHGLDFAGLLNTYQALGAKMLVDIIRDIDEQKLAAWTLYGWYDNKRFMDDFSGKMDDDTTFISEAYFVNEMRMDDLWYKMPCLKIDTCETIMSDDTMVCIGVSMAPYEREEIMNPMLFEKMIIENEEGFPFPGSGASLVAVNENFIDKNGHPYKLKFRLPTVYCIRYKETNDSKWMHSWRFITDSDYEEMRDKLSKMRHEDWKRWHEEE